MTYARVIPRDLFNEGSLLNCLGLLTLKLEDGHRHSLAKLEHVDDGPFHIDQDPADGSISCANVRLTIAGQPCHLFRPLNARAGHPLFVRPSAYSTADWEEARVFAEDGRLSMEFVALIMPPSPDLDDVETRPHEADCPATDGFGCRCGELPAMGDA